MKLMKIDSDLNNAMLKLDSERKLLNADGCNNDSDRDQENNFIRKYRDRGRNGAIQQKLKKEITTTLNFDVLLGQCHFFEFDFLNPYDGDQVFNISCKSKEIRILWDAQEWKFYRESNNLDTKVELKMMNEPKNGEYQIYAKSKEKIKIPLTLQILSEIDIPKSIIVEFKLGEKLHSLLELVINRVKYSIDKSYVFYCCEQEQLNLRLPVDDVKNDLNMLRVQCSNQYVTCHVQNQQLLVKFRANKASESEELNFFFYSGPYSLSVLWIWQITIHTISKLSVDWTQGRSLESKFNIRGLNDSHYAVAYSSEPNLVSIDNEPFQLIANRSSELKFSVNAINDNHKSLINIVDVENQKWLFSYMVVPNVIHPQITKQFELKLQKGININKRVSYTNPFNHKAKVLLKTSLPELLDFKSSVLNLGPKQSSFICLRFKPNLSLDSAKLFVFLSNEQDNLEECLLINLQYYN